MKNRNEIITAIAGRINIALVAAQLSESGLWDAEQLAGEILDCVAAEFAEQAAYPDGWDGRNSYAMPRLTLQRVVRLLDCWEDDYAIFEAELCDTGDFSLQTYDTDGYTHGGFHFNRDKKAFYTVTHGTKSVATAEFDADTVGGVEAAVCAAKEYWRQTGLL